MTDHMTLRRRVLDAMDEELRRKEPSEAVLVACRVAIKKLDEAGHCKTFIDLCQPKESE